MWDSIFWKLDLSPHRRGQKKHVWQPTLCWLPFPPATDSLKNVSWRWRSCGTSPSFLFNELHCLGEHVTSFCRSQELQPRVVCRRSQISTVQALVALGQGVWLLPSMPAMRIPANGKYTSSLVNTRHAPSLHSATGIGIRRPGLESSFKSLEICCKSLEAALE